MIEAARQHLTNLNIIDKFELVCADIFEDGFSIGEKVDCAILSYAISSFINNYGMLKKLLHQCSKLIKDDGYLFIVDFQYVPIPQDNWWAGMYTTKIGENIPPSDFELFYFYID